MFMNTLQPTPSTKRPKYSKNQPNVQTATTPNTSNEVISIPEQSITVVNTETPSGLAYKIDTEVAHGCLKGGLKKTYKNITAKNPSSHKVSFDLEDSHKVSFDLYDVENYKSTMRPSTDTIIIHDAVPPAGPEKYIEPVVLSGDGSLDNGEKTTESSKSIESVKTIKIDDVKITDPFEEGGSTPAVSIEPKANTTIIRPLSNNTKRNKQLKKIRKTFKLGKQSSKRMVSIFCKNAEMITGLKKVHAKMKSVRLDDMKRYLVRKSLLSIGSPAPSDVIKQLYMSAVASGDIINHNDAVLLKNFMET
jgi:hypothetical protein